MPAAVEVEQLGGGRPHPPGAAELVGVRVGDERLVGHVEADHRHVDPALEDAARRLGVGPDVELGRRRAVPLADRAAHQHDPLRPGVRVQREEQRDVRERPGRHERKRPVPLPDRPRQEVDRVLGRPARRPAAAGRARRARSRRGRAQRRRARGRAGRPRPRPPARRPARRARGRAARSRSSSRASGCPRRSSRRPARAPARRPRA